MNGAVSVLTSGAYSILGRISGAFSCAKFVALGFGSFLSVQIV
jgi:hypothetical protein